VWQGGDQQIDINKYPTTQEVKHKRKFITITSHWTKRLQKQLANFSQIAAPDGRKIVPVNLDCTKLPLYQGTMDDGVSLPPGERVKITFFNSLKIRHVFDFLIPYDVR
jgi:hypothetical protein